MKSSDCKDINRKCKQYRVKLPWWKRMLGYCPCCGRYFRWPVTTERRNTAYCKEANNYMTACQDCHKDDYEYYAELWNDYYNTLF